MFFKLPQFSITLTIDDRYIRYKYNSSQLSSLTIHTTDLLQFNFLVVFGGICLSVWVHIEVDNNYHS